MGRCRPTHQARYSVTAAERGQLRWLNTKLLAQIIDAVEQLLLFQQRPDLRIPSGNHLLQPGNLRLQPNKTIV
jgi:hypothetical protein